MTFDPLKRNTDLPAPVDVAWRIALVVLELLIQLIILPLNAMYEVGVILTRDVLRPIVKALRDGRKALRHTRKERERFVKRQVKAARLLRDRDRRDRLMASPAT